MTMAFDILLCEVAPAEDIALRARGAVVFVLGSADPQHVIVEEHVLTVTAVATHASSKTVAAAVTVVVVILTPCDN